MKPSKKHNQETLVSFVLDETGSMSIIRDATISGFNEYIRSLKKEKADIYFTLTKFNSDKTEVVYNARDIVDVDNLTHETYRPDNNTPLYDAIGKTIKRLEQEADNRKVMMVIMTDGQENASREYNQKQIFELIRQKKEKGWVFTFLGANQDSWSTGMGLGIPMGNSINFVQSDAGTHQAYRVMATATNNFAMNAHMNTSAMFNNAKSVEDYELQEGKKTSDKTGKVGKSKGTPVV